MNRWVLLTALVAAALIGLLLLRSAADRDTGTEPAFRIWERDGVTIAENRGGPKYQEELFGYEPVRTLRQDENRPESLIGEPSGACRMGEDGSVYLHDRTGNRILRFDPAGVFANSIGRRGQGPGEYESPRLLQVRDETIMLFDPSLARTTLYRPEGLLIRTLSAPMIQRRRSFDECHPLPDGGFLLIDRVGRHVPIGYEENAKVVTVFSPEGDTLSSISTGMVRGYYSIRGLVAWRIFPGGPNAAYFPPGGIYLTTGLEPVIDIYDLSGRITKVIEVGLADEPVTRTERQAVEAGLRRLSEELLRQYPQERSREEERNRYVELNDPKAHWSSLSVDENGWIWLGKPDYMYWILTGDRTADYRPTYRVLSPAGEYLGETNPPARWGTYSRGHFIATHTHEETGGIDIVVYRIVPAVEGLAFPD